MRRGDIVRFRTNSMPNAPLYEVFWVHNTGRHVDLQPLNEVSRARTWVAVDRLMSMSNAV